MKRRSPRPRPYNLTSSDELAFLVSVENQGNMAEKDVPVVVTLVSPDSTEPQVVTVTIPELEPMKSSPSPSEVSIPPPTEKSPCSRWRQAPVKDEKFQDNNSLEANVIFTLSGATS